MKTVPDRDYTHKHYLPSKFYPLNIFPKHLSGSGYVVSMSIGTIFSFYDFTNKNKSFFFLQCLYFTNAC